jgi:hypothetical protein
MLLSYFYHSAITTKSSTEWGDVVIVARCIEGLHPNRLAADGELRILEAMLEPPGRRLGFRKTRDHEKSQVCCASKKPLITKMIDNQRL